MKRIFGFLFVSFLVSFFMIKCVSAECSYEERKELINKSNDVNIYYDILTKKEERFFESQSKEGLESRMVDVDYVKFNVLNLDSSLMLKVSNDFDDEVIYIDKDLLIDGIYFFEGKDLIDFVNYTFEFISNNNNCLGYEISTKKIVQPKYNVLSSFEICNHNKTENSKYCDKYIQKPFNMSDSQIVEKLSKLIGEEDKNEEEKNILKNILQYFITYWYFIIVVIILIIIFIVVLVRRKRRSRL